MSDLRSDATQASLRDEVIDRMAEALWISHEQMRIPGVVWGSATAALDALLDYLEAHALEWKREGGRVSWEKSEAGITDSKRNEAVSNLIDALRVTDEG